MTASPPKMSTLWLMLASTLLGTFIGTMGNSIVSIALPSLMDHYSVSLSVIVWSITLYTLTFSVFIPIFGSLSRAIGLKSLYLAGSIIVTLSSLLCILAPNYPLFLIARIAQGIGVATTLPTIMGMISFYYPTEIQGKAIGYWALVNSFGHAIGPTVGGFLLSQFAWQSIFWINIPLGLVAITLTIKVFPKDERIRNRWFDWNGAAAMTVMVFAGMMGISRVGSAGFQDRGTIILLAIAAIALAFLLWYERRIDNPFVNLALFKRKNYVASIIPISLQAFAQFGLLVSLPVFLINIHNVGQQLAGLVIMSMTMMMALTSPFAGRLTDRWSSRRMCQTGVLLVCLGAILMFAFRTETLGPWNWVFFIFCLIVFGFGFSSIQSGSTVAAIQAVPKEISGAATGFFHMIRFMSASLGSTVFGILLEVNLTHPLKGFYNAFILIIILAIAAFPITFWIHSHRNGQAVARQLEVE